MVACIQGKQGEGTSNLTLAPQEGGDTVQGSVSSGAASEVVEGSLIFCSISSHDLYLHGTVWLK